MTPGSAESERHATPDVGVASGPAESADRRLFGFAAGVWAASLAGLWLSPARAWTLALAVATLVLAVVAWLPALVARLRRRAPRSYRATAPEARRLRGRSRRSARRGLRVRRRPPPAPPLGTRRRSLSLAARPGRSCGPSWSSPMTRRRSAPVAARARLGAGAGAADAVWSSRHRVGSRLDARVLVFATDPAWRGLLPSQRLTASGRLAPPRAATSPPPC